MQNPKKVFSAEVVEKVAKKISSCDFAVSMSRYVTGDSWPWVITVGEFSWHRHLVVLEIMGEGDDAKLALLTVDQSDNVLNSLDVSKVERTFTLRELIANSYTGVTRMLRAEPASSKRSVPVKPHEGDPLDGRTTDGDRMG